MLVYALVARASDATVLAHHATVNGSFEAVTMECYHSFKHGEEERFTIMCDGYTFNFLVHNGYVVGVVADEGYGRLIPFACAKRICDAWIAGFKHQGRTAKAHTMDKAFSPAMQEEMEYCESHPDEMTKSGAVQAKVDEVKGIMVANVESVIEAAEKFDVVPIHGENLADQAQHFRQKGADLRARMWVNNFKLRMCLVVTTVLIIAAILGTAICVAGSVQCFGARAHSSVTSAAAGAGADAGAAPAADYSSSGGGAGDGGGAHAGIRAAVAAAEDAGAVGASSSYISSSGSSSAGPMGISGGTRGYVDALGMSP